MHTMDWTNPITGEDWHIHHNGDYSGNVIVSFPLKHPIDVETYERVHEDVEIPYDLLKELVGQEVASELISKFEDMGGIGTLEWVVKV